MMDEKRGKGRVGKGKKWVSSYEILGGKKMVCEEFCQGNGCWTGQSIIKLKKIKSKR